MPSPHRSPRITAAITPVSLRTLAILFVALVNPADVGAGGAEVMVGVKNEAA